MVRGMRDGKQIEMLRELLRTLLGVSSLPAVMSDLVSKLFQVLHKLELKCPNLFCHLHVSGVSRTTGQKFFVVVHDEALSADDLAKRAVKTVFTDLHSGESMALTAAFWRYSVGARVPTAALTCSAPCPSRSRW